MKRAPRSAHGRGARGDIVSPASPSQLVPHVGYSPLEQVRAIASRQRRRATSRSRLRSDPQRPRPTTTAQPSLFGSSGSLETRFAEAFFFSVQTFAGIGYGRLNPATFAADMLVTVESLFGLLGLALSTGLIFARFSRPTARILWSPNAVVAPYEDGTGLMLRIANGRRNQLIELQAKVIVIFFDSDRHRRYHRLALERDSVTFFPLSWTIVHPILESSVLHSLTEHDLEARHTEILVLLTGTDESMNQTVHARSSYVADEILWQVRIEKMFKPIGKNGVLSIDLSCA